MKAMVFRGPYRIRVEEKDRPSTEHPDGAIVRVTRAAIRVSDLHGSTTATDIDPLDRPSVPQERHDVAPDVPWDLPTPQRSTGFRERSIEHTMLPPVLGTVAPPKGVGTDPVSRLRAVQGGPCGAQAVLTGRRTEMIAGRRLHRGRGQVDRARTWLDPAVSNGWALVATAVALSALRRRGGPGR